MLAILWTFYFDYFVLDNDMYVQLLKYYFHAA